MIGSSNGQSHSEPEPSKPKGRFTGERLLRERPRVYRKVVELLAEPGMSINQITKLCRVSEHTVRAVRDRESVSIAERKQRLTSIFANVAEIASERMEELATTASLRDAGTTAGIATDKLLALTQDPQILANNHLHVHIDSIDVMGQFNQMLKMLPKSKVSLVSDGLRDDIVARDVASVASTEHKQSPLKELPDGFRTNSDSQTA